MQIYPDFKAQRAAYIDRPVITIGTFDGVHLGHRQVLTALTDAARALNGRPGVLTFHIHPRKVLTGTGPLWITSLPYRLRLFQQAGIDFTTFIPFSRELSLLSPREFVKQFLVDIFRVAGVVMGYDSCFGHKGSGTPEMMVDFGREFGFTVQKVPRVECNSLTGTLSSSAIRGFVQQGELGKAAQLLGRPVTLMGRVVRDQGRGAQLGFPTANLAAQEVLLPQQGVYASYVFVGPRVDEAPAVMALRKPETEPAAGTVAAAVEPVDAAAWAALGTFAGPQAAVTNIGVRPTVANAAVATVESHLLDFHGDLYDRMIAVVLVERLRAEQKFDGVEALKVQIGRDIQAARAVFGRVTPPVGI